MDHSVDFLQPRGERIGVGACVRVMCLYKHIAYQTGVRGVMLDHTRMLFCQTKLPFLISMVESMALRTSNEFAMYRFVHVQTSCKVVQYVLHNAYYLGFLLPVFFLQYISLSAITYEPEYQFFERTATPLGH